MDHTDLLVIGGGINGAGIARDAAGRGLSVTLVEQNDLASATSSASSKLIHGGLRYLEHGAFRLVREALAERAVLLRIAPHIAWPLRFVLPQDETSRPAWLLRLGLFIYDHLAPRRGLPGTTRLDLHATPQGEPLQPRFRTAFEYTDAWVDDARLVVLNALDAAEHGATILTRTPCSALRPTPAGWEADLGPRTIHARIVVNAAGPWVSDILHHQAGRNAAPRTRLVKGSHIVVPRLHDRPEAYILQNDDRRVIFVIPYEHDFSLIGTTDIPFDADPSSVAITRPEIDYLCRAVSRTFRRAVAASDIVHGFSGVRPLQDDGHADASAVTRDYKLHLETGPSPILSVFGGKITTYRRLAEHALELLQPHLPSGPPWTAAAPLPGGDASYATTRDKAAITYPFLPVPTLDRMTHAYGTRLNQAVAPNLAAMGEHFGAGLYESELAHLVAHEWAATADDVLWRRTKLGLRFTPAERARLEARLQP